MKFLDLIYFTIYKLLISRGSKNSTMKGRFSANASIGIALLIWLNSMSVILLFDFALPFMRITFYSVLVISFIITIVRYNGKKHNEVMAKYRKLEQKSEIKETILVYLYLILSPVLFVIALSFAMHR